jgi:hypothetical protein
LATADPGIAINPLALAFDNVPGTTATTQIVSVANTGSYPLQIGAPAVSTGSFQVAGSCGILAPGAMCSLTATYLPGTSLATDTLSLSAITTVGAPQESTYTVALSGNYTASNSGLQIVPGSAQYGAFAVGQLGPARLYTVNNLTAKSVALDVTIPRQFVLTSAPCMAVASNASCSFSLDFSPLTNGDQPGTVYAQGIPSDGSPTLNGIGYAEGYGIGSGTLTIGGALIVNGVLDFGQIASGQTASQTLTLSNLNPAGSPAITVRRVTSGPPFLSTTSCGAPMLAGQSCTVTVIYAPSNQVAIGTTSPTIGTDAGSLTIESDAATGPDIIDLSGHAAPVGVASSANAAPLATFALSQSSLTLPQTAVGDISATQAITLTNTGTVTLHVASTFSSADFNVHTTCATVIPGGTCTVAVSASPQSPGTHLASLEIASDSSTSLEFVSLISSGAPPALAFSPSSLNFGPLLVGSTTTLPLQVTNTSSNAVSFTSVAVTGDYTTAGSCPANGGSLSPNSACTVLVTFAPVASGARPGAVSITSSASTNPLSITLSGTGTIAQLVLNPTSLAFGNVALGSTFSLPLTLTNTGTVTITGLNLSLSGDYTLGTACPQTSLAPGATCTVQIVFTPSALGPRSASLTAVSSDPGSPASIPLTGTGVAPPNITLTVSGGSSATVSITSGLPATYQLQLTPVGGFTGMVALTCSPVIAAQFATCSLLPSSLTLSGSGQPSLATINTITAVGAHAALEGPSKTMQKAFFCLLFPGLLTVWKGRRQLRKRRVLLLALLFSASAMFSLGCASSDQFNTLYTPPGTYRYQVTASSTSGTPITQTVTLNLIVTTR